MVHRYGQIRVEFYVSAGAALNGRDRNALYARRGRWARCLRIRFVDDANRNEEKREAGVCRLSQPQQKPKCALHGNNVNGARCARFAGGAIGVCFLFHIDMLRAPHRIAQYDPRIDARFESSTMIGRDNAPQLAAHIAF